MAAIFGTAVFIILANIFFYVRQKYALLALNGLHGKFETLHLNKSKRVVERKLSLFKRQFLNLNGAADGICVDIQAYATFWCPSLSVFFACHITLQSYLLYIVLFINTIPLMQKSLFLCAITETALLFFVIIDLCARAVRFKRAIEVVNRRFYMSLLKFKSFKDGDCAYQLQVWLPYLWEFSLISVCWVGGITSHQWPSSDGRLSSLG